MRTALNWPNSGNVTSSIQTLEQAVQQVGNKTGLQLCEGLKLALMDYGVPP
jgi:hypothetical protein